MGLTHKQKVNKYYGQALDTTNSKKELTKLSGVPPWAIDAVYDKGLAAYYTSYKSVRKKGTFEKGTNAPPSQKLSPSQWAMARVYAFLSKILYGNNLDHDSEIYKKISHLIKK